jgi:hypothetical protein
MSRLGQLRQAHHRRPDPTGCVLLGAKLPQAGALYLIR